jgi:hypothetical protein
LEGSRGTVLAWYNYMLVGLVVQKIDFSCLTPLMMSDIYLEIAEKARMLQKKMMSAEVFYVTCPNLFQNFCERSTNRQKVLKFIRPIKNIVKWVIRI